ncbi:zinc transporter ZIP13 isoform X2 [Opisthocomus hoazin]|uniref:zinc transporter ZIP13 isoform X2 n=1 Tax=Opisthocomus hoazin TaxID=30419 RepID=UPI003F52F3CE
MTKQKLLLNGTFSLFLIVACEAQQLPRSHVAASSGPVCEKEAESWGNLFSSERLDAWICSLIGSFMVGLSGVFPLLVIPFETGAALRSEAGSHRLKQLLSFAIGGLLGNVFLHLLPEAWTYTCSATTGEGQSFQQQKLLGLWVITGFLTFLVLEKIFLEKEEEACPGVAQQMILELQDEDQPSVEGVPHCPLFSGVAWARPLFRAVIPKHQLERFPMEVATPCRRSQANPKEQEQIQISVMVPLSSLVQQTTESRPLQVLEGCSKVTPEPSLLQAEQPQLPQPVLIGEVLQPSDHLRGPPLDPLQHIHVLPMLGAPELDAVLQVGSHESGVKGQNHLPRPAG